jgi:hypothetical protein
MTENTTQFLMQKCRIISSHLAILNNKNAAGVLDNVQKKRLMDAFLVEEGTMSLFQYPEVKKMLQWTHAWKQMLAWNMEWDNRTGTFRKHWKELDGHIKAMVRNLSSFGVELDVSIFFDTPASSPQW